MINPEKEKLINRLREFFITTYYSPLDAQKVNAELQAMLEGPLLKYGLFNNNITAIIDNSTHRYLYISGFTEHWSWFDRNKAMEIGLDYTLQFLPTDHIQQLFVAIKMLTESIGNLPISERLHIRFNYNVNVVHESKTFHLFQQTIPLTLTESGLPHLVFVTTSDITEFTKDDRMKFKATLNLPNQPIKLLFEGSSEGFTSPLSPREKEIVQHLAEGHDSQTIADKLFISHDTVRTHRKNILEKTSAKNAVHLVQMAVANGWV